MIVNILFDPDCITGMSYRANSNVIILITCVLLSLFLHTCRSYSHHLRKLGNDNEVNVCLAYNMWVEIDPEPRCANGLKCTWKTGCEDDAKEMEPGFDVLIIMHHMHVGE